MVWITTRAALVLAVASASTALAKLHSPEPTVSSAIEEYDPQGWTARPTPPPSLELVKRKLLQNNNVAKRSISSGQLVGYLGSDETCGYINGELGAHLTCSPGRYCAAVAAVSGTAGPAGCCEAELGDCDFITECINYRSFYSSSACDHACQQNTAVLVCSDSALPYCYGYSFPQLTATLWQCDSTFATTYDQVLTTFDGETDSHAYTPVFNTGSSAPAPLTPASSSFTRPVVTPTTSPVPQKSAPIGAIVGGVVGGLVVIGATIAAVIFLCLRKRRGNRNAPSTVSEPVYQGSTGPSGPTQTQPVMSSVPAKYVDNRMSALSSLPPDQFHQGKGPTETVTSLPMSPAPPYQPTYQQQSPPMATSTPAPHPPQRVVSELGDGFVMPRHNGQGQQIYEAPV